MKVKIYERDGQHPHNIAQNIFNDGKENKSFSFKFHTLKYEFVYYGGQFPYWMLNDNTNLSNDEVLGFILAHVLLQDSIRVEFKCS